MIAIKEGAVFVADAHYPHHGDALFSLLIALEERRIVAPQLFLMGDIFDLLFGYNNLIVKPSLETIELLQKLSQNMEIYYLEGNHDFCLENIFPNIKVFSRHKQPIYGKLGKYKVALSHGDKYEAGRLYGLYSFLLRHKWSLMALRPFQANIITNRLAKLKQKDICRPLDDFKTKARAILNHYNDVDLVIEGHYHEGVVIDERYISLPALACSDDVGVVRNQKIEFLPWTMLLQSKG